MVDLVADGHQGGAFQQLRVWRAQLLHPVQGFRQLRWQRAVGAARSGCRPASASGTVRHLRQPVHGEYQPWLCQRSQPNMRHLSDQMGEGSTRSHDSAMCVRPWTQRQTELRAGSSKPQRSVLAVIRQQKTTMYCTHRAGHLHACSMIRPVNYMPLQKEDERGCSTD